LFEIKQLPKQKAMSRYVAADDESSGISGQRLDAE
jgi:hypothetical protein